MKPKDRLDGRRELNIYYSEIYYCHCTVLCKASEVNIVQLPGTAWHSTTVDALTYTAHQKK